MGAGREQEKGRKETEITFCYGLTATVQAKRKAKRKASERASRKARHRQEGGVRRNNPCWGVRGRETANGK